jgi:hypothetical protein
MSKRNALSAALDEMARAIPFGSLMAATDPVQFISEIIDAIEAARAGESDALEEVARWQRRWEALRGNVQANAGGMYGGEHHEAANALADVLCWMRALEEREL